MLNIDTILNKKTLKIQKERTNDYQTFTIS